jgi:hypothetical protein
MTNRPAQGLNRAKKSLLALAGIAALAGPVGIGLVLGIGHLPAVHAQPPLAIQPIVTAQVAQAPGRATAQTASAATS